MKIAINSLPRSGTKLLQANFQRYLKASGHNVLCPEAFDGIQEPFNFSDRDIEIKLTKTGIIEFNETKILFGEKYIEPVWLSEEVKSRFIFLTSLQHGWVYKRTPFTSSDPILYDSAVKLDKCIAVIKQNTFEHCVSFVLARKLNIWATGNELNQAIKTFTKQRLELDTGEFRHFYKWFKDFNNIKWHNNIQVVKFEEMVKLSNSKEFCEFFQIPFIEFEFHPFLIEYGENKLKMVDNVEELFEIAAEIDKEYA